MSVDTYVDCAEGRQHFRHRGKTSGRDPASPRARNVNAKRWRRLPCADASRARSAAHVARSTTQRRPRHTRHDGVAIRVVAFSLSSRVPPGGRRDSETIPAAHAPGTRRRRVDGHGRLSSRRFASGWLQEPRGICTRVPPPLRPHSATLPWLRAGGCVETDSCTPPQARAERGSLYRPAPLSAQPSAPEIVHAVAIHRTQRDRTHAVPVRATSDVRAANCRRRSPSVSAWCFRTA